MASIPDELKAVTPYVRRAGEVEKTGDPRAAVVAYFCRTYAMEQGLKISSQGKRSAEVQQFLLGIMNQLESAKKERPELADPSKCSRQVEMFAAEKMTEAEDEYMSGKANKNTARRYYAAASFFEVLATFREEKELDDATKKQALFAKWRATEILKALKEGRPPVPSEEELQRAREADAPASSDEDDEVAVPPAAPKFSAPSRRAEESEEESEDEPPRRQARPAQRVSRKKTSDHSATRGLTEDQKSDALEYTRFALRAIETDDVSMAVKHLESALRELRG